MLKKEDKQGICGDSGYVTSEDIDTLPVRSDPER
jgi:hypothetical protein